MRSCGFLEISHAKTKKYASCVISLQVFVSMTAEKNSCPVPAQESELEGTIKIPIHREPLPWGST